jgi:hypothetical protein
MSYQLPIAGAISMAFAPRARHDYEGLEGPCLDARNSTTMPATSMASAATAMRATMAVLTPGGGSPAGGPAVAANAVDVPMTASSISARAVPVAAAPVSMAGGTVAVPGNPEAVGDNRVAKDVGDPVDVADGPRVRD